MIIDQLPLLSGDVESTDEIPIERGTTTYKTTQAALVKSAAEAAAAAQTSADNAQTAADDVASSLATYVRPNLLENWYFVGGGSQQGYGYFPLNSNGQASYNNAGDCIDRWMLTGNTIKCQLTANGIVLNQRLSQTAVLFSQLSGKTITVSVLTSTEFITVTTTLPTAEPTAWTRFARAGDTVTVNLDYDQSSKTVQVVISANVDSTIKAAKLELGATQSLAHQEGGTWVLNEVPSYGEEYAETVVSRGFVDITSAFTPTSGVNLQALKIGNMVIVRAKGQRANAPTTEWALASIPAQYRPSDSRWVGSAHLNGNQVGVCTINASTWDFIIPPFSNGSNWCVAEITWILGTPAIS